MAKTVELKGDVDRVTVCTTAFIFCATEEESLTCNSETEQGSIRNSGVGGMIYGFCNNELYEKSRNRSALSVFLIGSCDYLMTPLKVVNSTSVTISGPVQHGQPHRLKSPLPAS